MEKTKILTFPIQSNDFTPMIVTQNRVDGRHKKKSEFIIITYNIISHLNLYVQSHNKRNPLVWDFYCYPTYGCHDK